MYTLEQRLSLLVVDFLGRARVEIEKCEPELADKTKTGAGVPIELQRSDQTRELTRTFDAEFLRALKSTSQTGQVRTEPKQGNKRKFEELPPPPAQASPGLYFDVIRALQLVGDRETASCRISEGDSNNTQNLRTPVLNCLNSAADCLKNATTYEQSRDDITASDNLSLTGHLRRVYECIELPFLASRAQRLQFITLFFHMACAKLAGDKDLMMKEDIADRYGLSTYPFEMMMSCNDVSVPVLVPDQDKIKERMCDAIIAREAFRQKTGIEISHIIVTNYYDWGILHFEQDKLEIDRFAINIFSGDPKISCVRNITGKIRSIFLSKLKD